MYSLNTIVSGETLHYKIHLALNIGQYCQVHEDKTPRNIQASSTKPQYALAQVETPKVDSSLWAFTQQIILPEGTRVLSQYHTSS